MSQKNKYTPIIALLNETQLDNVAKYYLSDIEDFDFLLKITSGDSKKVENLSKDAIQYLISIKKFDFKTELLELMGVAQANIQNYQLGKKVYVFCKISIEPIDSIQIKKEIKEKFNIILNLIDSTELTAIAEIHDTVSEMLLEFSGIKNYEIESNFLNDEKSKTFYDLMSFGTSTDIKYNIIKAFVLNHLFGIDFTSKSEVLSKINEHFNSKIDANYFEHFLNKLRTEKKITIVEENISLLNGEKTRINNVLENYKIEVGALIKSLTDVLKDYNLEKSVDEFIIQLSEIDESSYKINLSEFTKNNSNISDFNTSVKRLKKFIENKIGRSIKNNELLGRLMEVVENSDLLPKIAAGRFYSKVNNPDEFQTYINQNINNKDIFLDTNVLIYLACVTYNEDAYFDDYKYKEARQFYKFAKKNNLKLKTVRRYVMELAGIFKEALSIIPFTKLPVFEAMGGSKNILYRFYNDLKEDDFLDKKDLSFEEFLKEFRCEIKKNDPSFQYSEQMKYILSSLGIEIEEQEYEDISRELDVIQSESKNKSHFSAISDAKMFKRLGDEDVSVNPIDPIFCTWDNSLFSARNKYFKECPSCTKWFMFTPYRLMDHYAMMNFKLKLGSISNEVLSIMEEDYGFQKKAQSLLDSMITIVNPENKVGLLYTNKLAELRKEEIIQVNHKTEGVADSTVDSKPVDIVFNGIFKYYFFNNDSEKLNSIKDIFTKEEYFEEVFGLIKDETESISTTNDVRPELFQKLDAIITKSAQKPTE